VSSTCGPGVEGLQEISGARAQPVMRGKKKGKGKGVPTGVPGCQRKGEMGRGKSWAERQAACRRGKEGGPWEEKVGRRWTGLLVELLLYFPFLFLFQTQTQTY
jgi:hypothetical protein